ncbi:MAG: kynureninase, partial [Candidatus Promineifilaceae bacterium]|nr:kynureninase [Candidatus Promineifilaceae bacterium]
MSIDTSSDYARERDAEDPLGRFRDRFVIPDPTLIYLDGNSLGRLPKATAARLKEVVEQEWGQDLIRGWNQGWFDLPERVGTKLARIVGARADEVIMADATSVNLYKLAMAAVRARPNRTKIVSDTLNFPSDIYILQGVAAQTGTELQLVQANDERRGPVEGLAAVIDDDTALVSLTHTAFKSGYTYDMAAVTEMAHAAGALILWDCSHSVGAMPIALNNCHVDLAVGCSYKYLNGGPGAPAFLYVRRVLQEPLGNPIPGWMGQKNPFEFNLHYEPTAGLRRFLSGTPPVLGLAAVEPGLDLLLEAGLDAVRLKSVGLSDYLIRLWAAELAPLGYRLRSPRQAARRGSHVSLGHQEGWRINEALIQELNVLPDFRRPD